MPIYEFFCDDCNTVFNFYSSRTNVDKQPDCPKCGKPKLQKQMSVFAVSGKTSEDEEPFAGMDESKMEQAFEGLMREADSITGDDPRQMAALMRKFSDKTGLSLGENMEEALSRLEAGEDPERVEKEMGDIMDSDDGLTFEAMKRNIGSTSQPPTHDETLYEL